MTKASVLTGILRLVADEISTRRAVAVTEFPGHAQNTTVLLACHIIRLLLPISLKATLQQHIKLDIA